MGRLSLILKLISLVIITFSILGMILALTREGVNAGGYFCLLTLGTALYLFTTTRYGGKGR